VDALAVEAVLPLQVELGVTLPDSELLGLGEMVLLVVGDGLELQDGLPVAVFMGRLLGFPATFGLPVAV